MSVQGYLLAGFLLACVLLLLLLAGSFRWADRPLSGRVAEAHASADRLAAWVTELNETKEQNR